MTATKEQPNQRAGQPQQDEVGNCVLFLLICVILPLYPRAPSRPPSGVSAYQIVLGSRGAEGTSALTPARSDRRGRLKLHVWSPTIDRCILRVNVNPRGRVWDSAAASRQITSRARFPARARAAKVQIMV